MNHDFDQTRRTRIATAVLLMLAQAGGCRREEARTDLEAARAALQHAAKAEAQHRKTAPNAVKAQEGSHRPRGLGIVDFLPTVRLVETDAVRRQLELTEDQKKKLDDVEKKRRQADQYWSEAGEGAFRQELLAKARAIRRPLAQKVAQILDESQRSRLAGIAIRVNGPFSLEDPYVAARLEVTDEQHLKVVKIRKRTHKAMHKVHAQSRGRIAIERLTAESEKEEVSNQIGSDKDTPAMLQNLRSEAGIKLLAVLTAEQSLEFGTLEANAANFDLRQIQSLISSFAELSLPEGAAFQ